MNQQLPIPDRSPGGGQSNSGDISIKAPIAGDVVLIGHNNMAVFQLKVRGAKDATLHLNPQDPRWQQLMLLFNDGTAQSQQLASGGFSPTIATPCLRPEDFQPSLPFSSPLGIPAPHAAGADQLAGNFAALYQFLGQLDQQFGGPLLTLNQGQQALNISDLLLQKGNQALWRFRQGALNLFAEQASLYALAEPQNPAQPLLGTFQAAARVNLDVLRGWVLFQKYRSSQGALIDQAAFTHLSQGHWQIVLDSWMRGQRLPQEQIQAEGAYLQAIGDRYDAQAVQTAARDAEWFFTETLRRQPDQSVALINLAALLAESALLAYIETGNADRARLQQAQSCFQQAHAILDQRSDQAGQIALAQCLLYEATSLPPAARLEMVQWAANQEQQLRAALGPGAPGSVRWDIAQRNLARRDPSFIDWQKLERARDIFAGVGAMAVLSTLAQQLLGLHASLAQAATTAAPGLHSTGSITRLPSGDHSMSHPGSSGEQSMSHPVQQGSSGSQSMSHPIQQGSSGGQNISHAAQQGSIGHGTTAAARVTGHGAAHGIRHVLSTAAGKVIVAVVVTTVVAASAVGVVLAHRSSGLASAYQGTAHNTTVNQSSSLVLTSIVEDQQKISGEMYWGYPLFGNGPFTGTLGSNGSVTLTSIPVYEPASQVIFRGSLHPDGSLSGTYTAPSSGQTGTWQTTSYQIPSDPHLVSMYHGTTQNYSVGGTATLALTSVVQNQQKISGNLVIGPGLVGTGSFTGTIGADGGITFIDNDTTDHFTITFYGFLFADGSISGSYIIPSSGQLGNWKASPA